MMQTKTAADLKIGDQVVESEGIVLTVNAIERRGKYAHLSLSTLNTFGIQARLKLSAQVRIACAHAFQPVWDGGLMCENCGEVRKAGG